MIAEKFPGQLKIEFLTAAVFGQTPNSEDALIDSAINLAYRDLSRTMHGYSKERMAQLHNDLKDYIKSFIKELRTNIYIQAAFDRRHSDVCDGLIHLFKTEIDPNGPNLHYGQAQKWINMTLKYLLTLTLISPGLTDIEQNYEYFHVPIDSYILNDLGVRSIAWSKIDKEEYLNYQTMFKAKYPNEIPIVREFRVWNTRLVNS